MNLLTVLRNYKTKIETKKLYQELANRKMELRHNNMLETLNIMSNYLVADQLERTGILYSPSDLYIQNEVQRLFFEWKREGIINEFETFNDETWNWIEAYI